MLDVFALPYATIMRINVANVFAQPIFQSPLQIHIMLKWHRGENTGPKMWEMCFCRTNPRPLFPWHVHSTVAELLPPKQIWNSEKAIPIAGTRTDEISEVRTLRYVSLNFQSVFLFLGQDFMFSLLISNSLFFSFNLQVKSFPFPWWVSRQGVCPSGSEDAGYLSALGAWKSRSCLKQSREENSFRHLQKCHTLLKRFTRCYD